MVSHLTPQNVSYHSDEIHLEFLGYFATYSSLTLSHHSSSILIIFDDLDPVHIT